MRIVITGASGNVGTAVLRRVKAESAIESITGISRRRPPRDAPPYDGVDWVSCDIGVPASESLLRKTFAGADVVVHLAWLIQPSHRSRLMERVNVEGSRRVAQCAAAAGVPHVVYASSVGAYGPKRDDRPVAEDFPTTGIATSYYSRQKAAVEQLLDEIEREQGLTVTRLRPGLIFQHDAGSQIARYFLGPLAPTALLRPDRVPVLPFPAGLRLQAVHADDVADAYARAVVQRPGGAFNVAAEPVLDRTLLGAALHAPTVPMPAALLRLGASLSWHARLQPVAPGWLDLAMYAPLLDTSRAHEALGWTPERSSVDAVLEVLRGMAEGAGTASPSLRRRDQAAALQALTGRVPGTERLP